ncbi:MAG TPA: SURF1 family cytochrome oxidase biogenesis protein, partial [Novosphingobium sp.]|nr:SURF1 family cytochrome oxidase biogenesis protein [Novosphingobium sp.]
SRVGQIAAATPTGRVTVVGLLRKSEPHGSFLRPNRPQDDRWYGRDIAAMAAARHIASEPAWFVDAQAENPAPPAAQAPVPGLTVIAFPNNHLSYALTWFALCALSLGLAVFIGRGRL